MFSFNRDHLDYLLCKIFMPNNLFILTSLDKVPLLFVFNVTLDHLIFTDLTVRTKIHHQLPYLVFLMSLPDPHNIHPLFALFHILRPLRPPRHSHDLLSYCNYHELLAATLSPQLLLHFSHQPLCISHTTDATLVMNL